jgi:hypothetical protein
MSSFAYTCSRSYEYAQFHEAGGGKQWVILLCMAMWRAYIRDLGQHNLLETQDYDLII